jgi:hypothetical protein
MEKILIEVDGIIHTFESMNVNALEIVVNNLYEAYRVKVGAKK